MRASGRVAPWRRLEKATPEATAPARTRRARRFLFITAFLFFFFFGRPGAPRTPPPIPAPPPRPRPAFSRPAFPRRGVGRTLSASSSGALGLHSRLGVPSASRRRRRRRGLRVPHAARRSAAGSDGPPARHRRGLEPRGFPNAFAPASSNAATHRPKRTRRSGARCARADRADPRRRPPAFPAAPREHQVHAGARAAGRGEVQGGGPRLVHRVEPRAGVQKRGSGVDARARERVHQRRVSVLVPRVDVPRGGAGDVARRALGVGQKRFEHGDIARGRRDVKRGVLGVGRAHRAEVAARVARADHLRDIAALRRGYQRVVHVADAGAPARRMDARRDEASGL